MTYGRFPTSIRLSNARIQKTEDLQIKTENTKLRLLKNIEVYILNTTHELNYAYIRESLTLIFLHIPKPASDGF